MNKTPLENYIVSVLSQAKHHREVKGISAIKYRISTSNVSNSLYLKLYLPMEYKVYKRTLRFSDHKHYSKIKGIIMSSPKKLLNKKEKKHIKMLILKECKSLLYDSAMHTIHTTINKAHK